jgi:hypothetical protein
MACANSLVGFTNISPIYLKDDRSCPTRSEYLEQVQRMFDCDGQRPSAIVVLASKKIFVPWRDANAYRGEEVARGGQLRRSASVVT